METIDLYWDYDHDSGSGSRVEVCGEYIEYVSRLIRDENVRTVVDLGCGDFVVGSAIDYGTASVIGVDGSSHHIARHLETHASPNVSFIRADVESFGMDRYDLVLCKDVLQHWPSDRIISFLSRPRPKLLLLTNDNDGGTVNGDIEYLPTINGHLQVNVRGLNLNEPPFSVCGTEVLQFNGKTSILLRR